MRENFSDKLSAEDEKRLAAMVLDHPIQAIKDLQDLTNCSLSEGKVWVDNKREEIFQESLPPCPFCGNKLGVFAQPLETD